jgi:hypothetical protein
LIFTSPFEFFYFQSYTIFNFKNNQPHSVFVTDRTLFDYASNGTKTWKDAHLGGYLQLPGSSIDYFAGLSVRDPFLTPFDKKDVSQLSSHAFCLLVGSETKN